MTAIGKMLVFLVLVLSLVWNGLVVNAYATRANWRDVAKKAQDKATEAAASANEQRKLLDSEREAADDRVRVVREDRDALYKKVADLTASYAGLNKTYQDKLKTDAAQIDAVRNLQTQREALQDQVKQLNTLQGQDKRLIDTLTAEREAARVAKERAELAEAGQKRRAEDLLQRLQNLMERAQASGRGGPLDRVPVTPQDFRGTVRTYDRANNYVSLTPGADAGLAKNAVLTVQRLSGGGKYVGKLTIIDVDAKDAVGRFTPAPGLRPDEHPRAGDELVGQQNGL